eukprot:scaffold118715_cov31-Tisochrysis_lutea.AAC.3
MENGIDIPNVNTIIVQDTQLFGLGQLHQVQPVPCVQDPCVFAFLVPPASRRPTICPLPAVLLQLRGRVGRSNVQAYALLMHPEPIFLQPHTLARLKVPVTRAMDCVLKPRWAGREGGWGMLREGRARGLRRLEVLTSWFYPPHLPSRSQSVPSYPIVSGHATRGRTRRRARARQGGPGVAWRRQRFWHAAEGHFRRQRGEHTCCAREVVT